MPNTSTIVTPNMGLTEPGIGNAASPAWAAYVNADMGIIDQHDHTNGKGVQLTPASINVNTDFIFNGYNLLAVNSLDFSGAVTGTPSALSIYTNGTDFFYKDASGNQIQLTKAGGPNAGTGNIQNLPSTPIGGAGISWINSTSTFQFLMDSGATGANIDVGSVIIRYPGSYPTPSGNFILLEAPSSLSSGYSLTLPSLPPGQQIMTLDSGGNIAAPYVVDNSTIQISSNIIQVKDLGITTAKLADGAVTRVKEAAVGQQISSSSTAGLIFTNSTPFLINAQTVFITTTGRPVIIMMQPDGVNPGSIGTKNQAGTIGTALFYLYRNGSAIRVWEVQANNSNITPFLVPASLMALDTPTAGTYAYQFYVSTTSGSAPALVNNIVTIAYEL